MCRYTGDQSLILELDLMRRCRIYRRAILDTLELELRRMCRIYRRSILDTRTIDLMSRFRIYRRAILYTLELELRRRCRRYRRAILYTLELELRRRCRRYRRAILNTRTSQGYILATKQGIKTSNRFNRYILSNFIVVRLAWMESSDFSRKVKFKNEQSICWKIRLKEVRSKISSPLEITGGVKKIAFYKLKL